MAKILISTGSFGQEDPAPLDLCRSGNQVSLNPYGRKLTTAEFVQLAEGAEGVIAGTETIDRHALEKLRGLKVISRCGAGMENVDLKAAEELGIRVFNTPDAPTQAVAELTVGLVFDLLRRISVMAGEVKAGTWKKHMGNLLRGKKVGIIGFGRIGRKVAGLLMPFMPEISYFDVGEKQPHPTCTAKPKDELLRWADIVSLHCSAPPDGTKVIGRDELALMKKGVWLINTSRGELVDESALCEALRDGKLSGAALDVFEKEPYVGPLAGLQNVILTPHIGSYARESRIEMEMQAAMNLVEGLKGIFD